MAQHPLFLRFGELFREQRFEEALSVLDRLIQALPNAPQLAWHRANCLEKLERFEEIPAELDRVLAGAPDYVPAIVKRVRYTPEGADLEQDDADPLEAGLVARAQQAAAHVEAELRRALRLQPDNVEALELLSGKLRYREEGDVAAARAEAAALLDRAIELSPERVDLLETRANALRSAAGAGEDADSALLARVLADYERCLALSGHHRYAVRMGMLLHELERFDEAVDAFDLALAGMDDDDPMRGHVAELRLRSLDQSTLAGPRDGEFAEPWQAAESAAHGDLSAAAEPEAYREVDDTGIDKPSAFSPIEAAVAAEIETETDSAYAGEDALPLAAEPHVEAASTLPSPPREAILSEDALAPSASNSAPPRSDSVTPPTGAPNPSSAFTRPRPGTADAALRILSDDEPDAVTVKRCVQRILDVAYPPAPQLEEINSEHCPAYQRLYVERVGREIAALGVDYIGDGEQAAPLSGARQHGLIRCFADEEGEFVVLASALHSDRPDWQTYLSLRLSRQWQSAGSVECLSQFEDGAQLWTCIEHNDPFNYGAPVDLELLPAGTSVADLVARHLQRHAAYRAAQPGNPPLIAHDVEAVDLRWRAALKSRQDYRLAIGGITEQELRALLGEQYERLSHAVLALLAQCLDAAD